jgi:hypothetical protein
MLDDHSGFNGSRPPAWCDRIMCTEAAIPLLVIPLIHAAHASAFQLRLQGTKADAFTVNANSSVFYGLVEANDPGVGDHTIVYLSFKLN